MLLHQAVQRGLLRSVALVVQRGATGRPLGPSAGGVHDGLPSSISGCKKQRKSKELRDCSAVHCILLFSSVLRTFPADPSQISDHSALEWKKR